MQAARFNGPGVIETAQYDIKEPPPGWVTLKVAACGLCGSDLHLLHAHGFPNEGMRPGHEFCGYIEAVGDGVDLGHGELVTVEPLLGCKVCFSCSTARPARCDHFRIFGLHEPGGFAEYVNVPQELVYRLPESIEPVIGALTEPMAVVVRGVRLGKIKLGSRVAVLGGGSIGQLSVLAARAAGATEVFATARYPHQAEMARHMGADEVFLSGEELKEKLGTDYIDVVLETVGGTADTLVEACKLVRAGGTIVMIGIFEGNARIPGFAFAVRELTLLGSNCYARDESQGDFAVACNLIARHERQLRPLVSHTFSLDQVGEAFAVAADKTRRAIKVQVLPTQHQ